MQDYVPIQNSLRHLVSKRFRTNTQSILLLFQTLITDPAVMKSQNTKLLHLYQNGGLARAQGWKRSFTNLDGPNLIFVDGLVNFIQNLGEYHFCYQ